MDALNGKDGIFEGNLFDIMGLKTLENFMNNKEALTLIGKAVVEQLKMETDFVLCVDHDVEDYFKSITSRSDYWILPVPETAEEGAQNRFQSILLNLNEEDAHQFNQNCDNDTTYLFYNKDGESIGHCYMNDLLKVV